MSAYAYNTLTADGAALIAQATAANPIVMVGSLSKATAASSVSDLATKSKTWYDGKTGTISAASATASVARIIAVYRNAGTRQAAKAICITARLASQTDADAVVLCAMSDPDATVDLPGANDTGQGVEIPFNIAINAADVIQATPGASASLADLERFVSMHAAGNPSQGEQQHIYGWKIFHGQVSVYDDLSARLVTVYRSSGGSPLLTIDPDGGTYGEISSSMRVYLNALTIQDTNGVERFTLDLTEASESTDLTINARLKVTEEIEVGEYSKIGDDLYIGGDAEISGAVKVDEDLEVNGDLEVDGKIRGVTPTPGDYPPPVGSHFWAFIPTPQGYGDKDIGTTVTATSIAPLYYAGIQTMSNNGVYAIGFQPDAITIETGTYTLLAAIAAPVGSPSMVVAFVMRTA